MNEPWRISLLGGLRVEGIQTTITRFNSQKTAGLLAYLAYYLRHMQAREVLIDIFWPEGMPETGRHSLSVALSTLRNQLEPLGIPTGAVIRADRYSIGLNPSAVTTDVAEFEAAIQAATSASTATERAQLLALALDLYQERLLPGFYDEWIPAEQERLSGRFFDATHQLLMHLIEIGDTTTALGYARKAVSINPLHEEGNRSLMSLLVTAGQPGSALWQFKKFERRLEEESEEAPSASLRALARRIEKESGLEHLVVAAPLRSSLPLLHPSNLLNAGVGQLPDTVTFLMTEVEGSARLREQGDETFKRVLERHHMLLRKEFALSGGQEIKEGDASCLVAFASARKALHCAVACQGALSSEAWPEAAGNLAVRMALDTGDVEVIDGLYQGPALQQVGRMLTAAHGRQVLVSEPTAALVRRHLEEDALRLIDLGVYQLRDTPGLQRLFQVDYPGMDEAAFPPLSATSGQTANLPLRFTRFFGREQEIVALTEMLRSPEVRIVTVTGSGGTGKTRLALEVAEHLVESFAGAVYFAPLADVVDTRLIPGALLDILRVSRSPHRDPLEQVVEALNKQPSLLILDNLEQLIAQGGAEVVEALVSRVPTLKVLVTSRQLLSLSAEREYALAHLTIPDGGETPELLSVFESVRLFIDRATLVKTDFRVTNHNAAIVAELVSRLEGNPLAIELAAARAQVLTPAQMLIHLHQRFDFLVSRKRDVSKRHRTLHAAVDWSYQLLSPELQRFFCRLSVFRGGWSVEEAEAVCEEPLALEYLAQLRECSLVLSEAGEIGMRFRVLETLREFGEEQLSIEEVIFLKRRHLECFLRLSEQYNGNFDVAPDNFRAALEWSKAGGNAQEGLRLAERLWHFWWYGGYLREGVEHLTNLLSREENKGSTIDRAEALFGKAWMAAVQGEVAEACALYEESLDIYRQLKNRLGIAGVLNALGDTVRRIGRYEEARSMQEESLAQCKELDNRSGMSSALRDLGDLALQLGNYADARRFYDESSAVVGAICSMRVLRFAEIALLEGDYAEARRLGEASVVERQNSPQRLGEALLIVAGAAMYQHDLPLAYSQCRESLVQFHKIGSKPFIAKALRRFAYLAVMQGRWERAARLLGANQSLCQTLGMPLPPCERDESEQNIASVRQALAEDAFAAAWAEGNAMTWDQAADLARQSG